MNVLDDNDNSPVFDPALYPVAISESTSAGSAVVRVFATDDDIGTNAMLSYNITRGNSSGKTDLHVAITCIILKNFAAKTFFLAMILSTMMRMVQGVVFPPVLKENLCNKLH